MNAFFGSYWRRVRGAAASGYNVTELKETTNYRSAPMCYIAIGTWITLFLFFPELFVCRKDGHQLHVAQWRKDRRPTNCDYHRIL